MPHSGGGGSHHGGSHHGSSHHSSSHHSSSHRSGSSNRSSSYRSSTGNRAFDRMVARRQAMGNTDNASIPGTQKYMYMDNGQPKYFYSSDAMQKSGGCLKGCLVVFLLPFIMPFFLAFSLLSGKVNFTDKLSVDSYDSGIVIEDNAGVLGNTSRLENTMETLLDKTGVSVAVVTVDNRVWQEGRSYTSNPDLYLNAPYEDLEYYSEDLYNAMFDDESHLLIVYSSDTDSDTLYDWDFETQWGNDVNDAIDSNLEDQFTDKIYLALIDNQEDPGDAMYQGVQFLINEVHSTKLPIVFRLVFIGFTALFAFLAVFVMVKIFKFINKRSKAVPVTEDTAGGAFPTNSPYGVPESGAATSPYGVSEDPSAGSPYAGMSSPFEDSKPYGSDTQVKTPFAQPYSAPTNEPAQYTPAAPSYEKHLYDDDDGGKVEGLFSGLFKRRSDDDYE